MLYLRFRLWDLREILWKMTQDADDKFLRYFRNQDVRKKVVFGEPALSFLPILSSTSFFRIS